eukprot:TRINITY_DN23523_c1_g1_i7.p1 TRINITY_DN23523_c1_g1~~TRINITY_DN23523_c1_g1_i7.p1  ORF type:complete len:146 (-),score=9.05 TRINITY_DN23523_c1_g1_i7:247-684(-)
MMTIFLIRIDDGQLQTKIRRSPGLVVEASAQRRSSQPSPSSSIADNFSARASATEHRGLHLHSAASSLPCLYHVAPSALSIKQGIIEAPPSPFCTLRRQSRGRNWRKSNPLLTRATNDSSCVEPLIGLDSWARFGLGLITKRSSF